MIVLGIDTSTSFASVGLMIDDAITTTSWYSRHNHGRETMPAVSGLLNAAGLEPSDIDVVAVALGPGGFSAVRVGIATGQGLVEPSQAQFIGIPTHLIQAYPYRDELSKRVVSLLPIGRDQVSHAVYDGPFGPEECGRDIGACGFDEISEIFKGDDVLLCGEGASGEAMENSKADAELFRSPKDLLRIALSRVELGASRTELVEPIYSRPPTITAPRPA